MTRQQPSGLLAPGHRRSSGCIAAPRGSDPRDARIVQLPHRQLRHVLAAAADRAACAER